MVVTKLFLKALTNSHGLAITDYKQATGVRQALILKFMAPCVQTWFEAFVKAVDPNFELVTTEENGTRLYTIKKK